MHFKSIEVEQFQQFRSAVAVRDLTARLNVIAGHNETGKSTLVRAIRAALFDRYTGIVGERFRPYGTVVSPKVCLVFDLDATEYRLTKVFSRRRDGEATLEASDGRRWEGPEAEDHLAELLGFSYAGRGGSRPELQGLAGLLWVDQARGYEPVTLTDRSRQQVYAVFENEMRELLGGDQGEALHRRITALRREYFDARGKPRGDYRHLQEREAELRQQMQAIRGELEAYEDKVDRLEQQQAELLAYREARALEKAEERARLAQAVSKRVTELRAQVQAGKEQCGRANAEWESAKQAWASRTRLIDECREAQVAEQIAEQAVRGKETELAHLNEQLAQRQDWLAALKSRQWDRDAELRMARDAAALRHLVVEYERLNTRLEEARGADVKRLQCVSERAALRVTEKKVLALKQIERARDLAAEHLHAAATQVAYRLEPGAVVKLGEEPLAGDGSVRLTWRTELQVEGIGRFTVTPGGEDLDALWRKVEQADRRLGQGLSEVDTDSIAGAETMLRRSGELDSQASQHTATLKGLAPEGLRALEDQLSTVGAQRDNLRRRLGEDAGREFGIDGLKQAAQTLQNQVTAIESDVYAEENLVQRLREALAGLRAERLSAGRLAKRCTSELEWTRIEAPDDRLMETLKATEQRFGASHHRLEAATRALEAEHQEAVELEIERSGHALEDIKQAITQLEREVHGLRVELRALGQIGLAEAVASVTADHAFAALQLEQANRQARALDLLQRTLDAALQRAKTAVTEPVVTKLVPYLRRLIPDAVPTVNEYLIFNGIKRGGTTEAFEDLSIGTREQLAVLVRLAYADLLSEAGEPVTVILDDALVNSDDERREWMIAILYQAAQRYQILLLTCHGKEYRDTGGTFIWLENALEEGKTG